MNNETHEMLGFLKGIQHISNYCTELVNELEQYCDQTSNIKTILFDKTMFKEDINTVKQIDKYCQEQIILYKSLVKFDK